MYGKIQFGVTERVGHAKNIDKEVLKKGICQPGETFGKFISIKPLILLQYYKINYIKYFIHSIKKKSLFSF